MYKEFAYNQSFCICTCSWYNDFPFQGKSDFPPERLRTFMESFYKLWFSFNLPVHITFVHFEMFCCSTLYTIFHISNRKSFVVLNNI